MLRTEYPRPQFIRKDWLCLNGNWAFDFDDKNEAEKNHWERDSHKLSQTIQVPFCFESQFSGIHDTSIHNQIFYKRNFEVPQEWLGQRILLHFGAVDYMCKIFIDEQMCKEHIGGHIGFSVDITDYLKPDKITHTLAVQVYDPAYDETIPRGKQFWEEKSAGIWYTRTSGIWQTVWLEPVSDIHITNVKYTPDIDHNSINLQAEFSDFQENMYLEVVITFKGELICQDTYYINNKSVFEHSIHLAKDHIFYSTAHGMQRFWSPENPALYDVTLKLKVSDLEMDTVDSYFGMRKIHTKDGITYLNNQPYYFKLVLDQGYWPEGILTAPSDDAFKYDIDMMKQMGFNGCRKHQKVEDPRFLYHADHMGFLVWGEMASSCLFTDKGVERYANEWFKIIQRDYSHPCIVAWVPFNESWAVPNIHTNKQQQHQTIAMYHLLKCLDPTRLVINNDGWEMTKTDICAIHNYAHGSPDEPEKQQFFIQTMKHKNLLLTPCHAGRSVYAEGFAYQGEPILITECGGINYNSYLEKNWGYTNANSEEDFLMQYSHVIHSILSSDCIYGFCYTQLSDVEQETNGLLTYNRKPKCLPAKIRAINDKYRHNIVTEMPTMNIF